MWRCNDREGDGGTRHDGGLRDNGFSGWWLLGFGPVGIVLVGFGGWWLMGFEVVFYFLVVCGLWWLAFLAAGVVLQRWPRLIDRVCWLLGQRALVDG